MPVGLCYTLCHKVASLFLYNLLITLKLYHKKRPYSMLW